jgi:hypothetical protein
MEGPHHWRICRREQGTGKGPVQRSITEGTGGYTNTFCKSFKMPKTLVDKINQSAPGRWRPGKKPSERRDSQREGTGRHLAVLGGFAPVGFELRASHLLGRHSSI